MLRNIIFLLLSCPVLAQTPGSLDPTFGSDGIVTFPVGSANDQGTALAIQPDGKILIAGNSFTSDARQEDFFVARLNDDGTPDNTFGTNGKVLIDFPNGNDVAKAVLIQPDGKILVAGSTQGITGINFAIARLLPNGTFDDSFGAFGITTVNFGSTDFCQAMVLQPDGKIILGGRAYNGSTSDFALVRLLTNGSADNDFGITGQVKFDLFGENESINALLLQPNGKIVAVGETSTSNSGQFAMARFQANGEPDPNFGTDGKVKTAFGTMSDAAYGVTQQLDGKIVVVGQSNSATVSDLAIARYRLNGTLDNTFSGDGKLLESITNLGDYGYAVNVQSDGKILVAGSASGQQEDVALFRYTGQGIPDASFGNNGRVIIDLGNQLQDRATAMLVDGEKILIAGHTGNFGNYDVAAARFEQGRLVETTAIPLSDTNAKLYPNPVHDHTTLELELPVADNLLLTLVNPLGQTMQEWRTGPLHTGQHQVKLNFNPAIPPGLYLLQVTGNINGRLQVIRI